MKKKILIFIVTYQSSFRVSNIIKKIKKLNLKKDLYKILISDDCSTDDTVNYIKKVKPSKNIKIILNKKRLHYGGNIKQCLNYAIKKKFNYKDLFKYVSPNLKKPSDHFLLAQSGDKVLDQNISFDKFKKSKISYTKGGNHQYNGFEYKIEEIINFLS